MAAESTSCFPPPPPPPPPPQQQLSNPPQQYWCHHCDKRVAVETLPDQPDVICNECKFGFVESIPAVAATSIISPLSVTPDFIHDGASGGGIDEPTLGNQFLHVLRLLAQVARDDNPAPPPPPPQPRAGADSSPSDDNDFLRIEIDPWNDRPYGQEEEEEDEEEEEGEEEVNEEENDEIDDVDEDEEEESVRSVEIEGGESDDDVEEREQDVLRRQRRELLRLRLRDFATRARSGGRNRILDWAEILMGLEDNSIEFRFEMPETDRYVGNPGDYVDAAEYEALLQNLAEAEGRRGAPPASKAAVEGLKEVEIKEEEDCYACAICKDGVNVGDVVKEMPCEHGYHGDCIVPWLAARNSCPVCRFELPTDDSEYEEERKKRSNGSAGAAGGSSGVANSSSSSGDTEFGRI